MARLEGVLSVISHIASTHYQQIFARFAHYHQLFAPCVGKILEAIAFTQMNEAVL